MDAQDSTTAYMMATQELQPTVTTDKPAEQNKENPYDDLLLFKTAHNNLKEAAAYVKDITKLVDTFMSSITEYDRNAQVDAFEYFVLNFSRQLKELDKMYFENPNVKTVLGLVPDKRCKPYVKRPAEEPTEEQNRTKTVCRYHSIRG